MEATGTRFSVTVLLLSVAALFVSTSAGGGGGGGYGVSPTIPYKELPKTIAIQGLIYCKSGLLLIPLKGATAKITCTARSHNGVEVAPISVSSCPADDKGYFLAKLSSPPLKHSEWILKECKAFIEHSPWNNCKVPLDINHGITGAHIFASSSHRLLKNVNLYSVGPFFYTTAEQHKPVHKNEGY